MTQDLTPFYFGGLNRPLFGCYHPARPPTRDRGYVLVQPLGHELIQFHRALKQLAVQLANAGFPTLRFDLFGCGDSAGDSEDWALDGWIGNVNAAIEDLRHRAGVAKVGVAGLRLGATLALLSGVSRNDIDEMVLWDPVVSGEAYLAELRRLHGDMVRYAHVEARPTGTGEEILGFSIPESLVADLATLNLCTAEAGGIRRTLVIETNARAHQGQLVHHLEQLGVCVERWRDPRPDLWSWVEDFGRVHVPRKALEAAVLWTREGSR